MAKRTKKLPPISPARQAIFDEYIPGKQGIAESLHRQLCQELPQILEGHGAIVCGITSTNNLEQDGNNILRAHFDAEKRKNQLFLKMSKAREKWLHKFFDTFKVSLSKYWQGNVTGLNLIQLDNDIIKSGNGSMEAKIKKIWGDEAYQMIQELCGMD